VSPQTLRKNKSKIGSIFIETAVVMPAFILLGLGFVEVANWYRQIFAVNNIARNIASAIQQNPRMTTTALCTYVNGLNSPAVPIPSSCSSTDFFYKMATGTTAPPTNATTMNGQIEWANPWLADAIAANDLNPWYLSVYVNFHLKPLFRSVLPLPADGIQIKEFATTLIKPLAGAVPIGGIIMWSGAVNAVPAGFALCDGNFGTPNLVNRFIVGAGGSYGVGATGGEATVTLTEAQMPSHTHANGNSMSSVAFNNRWYGNYGAGSGPGLGPIGGTPLVQYTGGNQPHENRPPYYALAYIMRIS